MRRDLTGIPTFHRRYAGHSAIVAAALAVALVWSFRGAWAVDGLVLDIDAAAGAGWRLKGLTVGLNLESNAVEANVSIAELALTDLGYQARDLAVACGTFELSGSRISCGQASIAADLPELGTQTAIGTIVYDRASGDIDLSVAGLDVADGRADVAVSSRSERQRVHIRATNADAAELSEMLGRVGMTLPLAPTAGRVDLDVTTQGRLAAIDVVDFAIDARGLSAGNEAGTLATESLDASTRGVLHHAPAGWRFEVQLSSSAGQAYAEPVFVDVSEGRVDARLLGTLGADGALAIDHFDVDHHDRVRASGTAQLRSGEAWTLEMLDARLDEIALPGFWSTYAAPFMLDTGFANLETGGRLAGSVVVRDGAPAALDLILDSVTADDGQGALAIAELSGEVHWLSLESAADVEEEDESGSGSGSDVSHLTWTDGSLFGLDLGAGDLRFSARGRGLRLLEETRIPVLDGAVRLEAFRIRNLAQDNVAFLIGAEIEPISVALLCRAFGWPEFGGTFAGSIKKLRMREGIVSLGTTLAAQVFDGEVRLSDLRLERPFGDWPRLFANIELESLDLEQVTSAFSFGRITGRLGGSITGLELFNWMPVTFDAKLATPARDRSKHRISQRAVENIGSLGGSSAGVTAAMSSGFLRFFEDFNYDRLGITCQLKNEVCLMGGVAPADNGGYYLVKGKGLPRIDVIGNRRRVDWPRLVRQLIAITESEGPVVE